MTSCPPTIKESVKGWEETLKPMAASDEMTGMNYFKSCANNKFYFGF